MRWHYAPTPPTSRPFASYLTPPSDKIPNPCGAIMESELARQTVRMSSQWLILKSGRSPVGLESTHDTKLPERCRQLSIDGEQVDSDACSEGLPIVQRVCSQSHIPSPLFLLLLHPTQVQEPFFQVQCPPDQTKLLSSQLCKHTS